MDDTGMTGCQPPGSQPVGSQPVGEGRVPTGAQAVTLRSQVAAVLHVLDTSRADAVHNPSISQISLVTRHGPDLEAAMLAMGEALADFLEGSQQRVDFEALRADFLEPILALSRSLPVYQLAEDWRQNKHTSGQLHKLLVEGRPVGYDVETLLLDTFYGNTVYARALLSRVPALAKLIRKEAESRLDVDPQELRLLVLGANTVLNLAPLFRNEIQGVPLSVLIVDGDARALRLARQHLEENLGVRPAVLRVKPESLAKGDARIRAPFDLVLTLMHYDTHSPQSALGFTRGLCAMLKPGGALLTGCFLPTAPRGYHALARVILDVEWQYWDEAMWRALLSQLPIDLSASRFETVDPLTLVISVRRSRSEASA